VTSGKPLRFAAAAVAAAVLAGCAQGRADEDSDGQVSRLLKAAYATTVARKSLAASVTVTVASGVTEVERGSGSASLWFAERAGRTDFSAVNATGSTTVVAVRLGDDFYEGRTQADLAGHLQNLVEGGQRDAQSLPQVRAAGLDPFQLLTLFSAVDWPGSVVAGKPVVKVDSAGQRTEYRLTVDARELARHVRPADRGWVTALAGQSAGHQVVLTATLNEHGIKTVSADLPVPTPPPAHKDGETWTAPPTSVPVHATVTDQFDYGKAVAPVARP
jgi:hypothetical protein